MPDPRVWIVSAAGDRVASRLPAAVAERGLRSTIVAAERLSDLRVELDENSLAIEGQPVAAIVFRAATNAPNSASFCVDDQAFCDAETRAVWLAALNSTTVLSFNRLDAIAWFESEHWTVWRRRLALANVRLARCEFGYARDDGPRIWLPFTACAPQADPGDSFTRAAGSARFAEQRFARHLLACGRVLTGRSDGISSAAVRALADAGVAIAEIATDEHGDVAWVDTFPRDLSDIECNLIATTIADAVAEHCS